ncbi:MAG: trehalose-phosphatase [Myxococcaceae bacterium]
MEQASWRRRWALGKNGQRQLHALVKSGPLVALDYDGTLCPIRRTPQAAVLTGHTHALLQQVCALFPVAIISGRSVKNLVEILGDLRPDYLVGNHGLEPGPRLARAARQVSLASQLLAPDVEALPGVELENKRYTLSLHYRRAPQTAKTRRVLIQLAHRWAPGLRQVEGKKVLNLIPIGGDKGRALSRLLGRSKRSRALFVGDDLTDEDAFKLPKVKVMSVRVGEKHGTAAGWYLKGRREVDELLAELICLGRSKWVAAPNVGAQTIGRALAVAVDPLPGAGP